MNYYVVRRNLTREERKQKLRTSLLLVGVCGVLLLTAGVVLYLSGMDAHAASHRSKSNIVAAAGCVVRKDGLHSAIFPNVPEAYNG